jgi:hypothetical protein
MTAPDAHLAELSDDQRQRLESWLVDFDLSWDEDHLAHWLRRLPPRGDRLRAPALVELVKIDLERRWQRGQPAKVEAYARKLPELGTLDTLPADLLLAEYEARQQSGAPADLAEFAQRFPSQAEELRRLIGQAGQTGASAQASHETARPAGPGTDTSVLMPGQAGRSDMSMPEQLGRYRIVHELGRGAMGTVYLAHDTQLDRTVALKVPRFAAGDGPEVRHRFFSEARAAATIEHPSVCPVYDVGEIDGIPYLTMAYIQGQSLARVLEGGALPERQAMSLVRQLAAALRAAHERGIVHRDLKPSNILINSRGEPVILDFGLARRLRHDGVRLTQCGQPLGTPAYMSPEQVAGAVGLMGPGCDIYALGVILYQLLTGRLPFEGSVTEVLIQIVGQPPAPPSKHRPDLDPRLDAICLKALRKDVADRYASMGDLAAALADCQNRDPLPVAAPIPRARAAPIPPAGPAVPPRAGWFAQKRLWILLAAGGVAAAGIAAVAVVVLTGVLFWIAGARGTIRIELEGARGEVEMRVDGERVDRAAMNDPLRLAPGKHHLMVTGKRIESVNTSFSVARGDNPPLQVHLVPRADDDHAPLPSPVKPRRERRDDDRDDD